MEKNLFVLMNAKPKKMILALLCITAGFSLSCQSQTSSKEMEAKVEISADASCNSIEIGAIGGPMPENPNIAVLRYLGTANYELSYRNQVILFDTFYSRVPPGRPLGVMPEDFQKADGIFIGHAHWDHIADIATVAENTGARVYGSEAATSFAVEKGVPESQTTTLRNGSVAEFDGFKITAVRGRHFDFQEMPQAHAEFWQVYRQKMPQLRNYTRSEQERLLWEELQSSGVGGERGSVTFTYLIEFENGYRIAYTDTTGPVTPEQKDALNVIGNTTNVAIVGNAGRFVPEPMNELSMRLVRLFNPQQLVLPSHHEDESGVGSHFDMPLLGFALAVREEYPQTRMIDPLYLTPICLDVEDKSIYEGI